jgi:hypothetical protein
MLAVMDGRAIRRAALATLRRAIRERFPPGRARRVWLAWAQRVSEPTAVLHYGEATSGRVSPCKQRSGI